jgi:hypothetical protein
MAMISEIFKDKTGFYLYDILNGNIYRFPQDIPEDVIKKAAEIGRLATTCYSEIMSGQHKNVSNMQDVKGIN